MSRDPNQGDDLPSGEALIINAAVYKFICYLYCEGGRMFFKISIVSMRYFLNYIDTYYCQTADDVSRSLSNVNILIQDALVNIFSDCIDLNLYL